MKILFTAPVYISNQLHYDFVEETINSIKTPYEHQIVLVENYICDDNYGNKVKALCDVLLPNPCGNNVSGGWNEGIKFGLKNGFDYIFVINLDIIFHKDAIQNIINYMEANKEPALYTCSEWNDRRTINSLELEYQKDVVILHKFGKDNPDVNVWEAVDNHPHFSCFVVTKSGIDRLADFEKGTKEPTPGLFDTGFEKAYFEDQDYHQRLLLAGLQSVKVNSSIFYHYGSRTIKSDEELENKNVVNYEANREYFKKKWGYDSHGQVPTDEERIKMSFKTAFNIPRDETS